MTQIDVAKYSTWLNNYTGSGQKFSGAPPTILYVADLRHVTSGTARQAAVRLVNASALPYNQGLGFTVATQNPIYIQGNYNTTAPQGSNPGGKFIGAWFDDQRRFGSRNDFGGFITILSTSWSIKSAPMGMARAPKWRAT